MIFARRGAPPREQVVGFGSYFPKSGGHAPTAPKRRALCPSAPGAFAGQQSLHPLCRRSALHPGDFPVAGKVTKGAPRAAAPGPCRCVVAALFGAALTLAPGLPSATTKDRFATLRWWANLSCFFLWFHRGNTLYFQSVARQGCRRGCLKV